MFLGLDNAAKYGIRYSKILPLGFTVFEPDLPQFVLAGTLGNMNRVTHQPRPNNSQRDIENSRGITSSERKS